MRPDEILLAFIVEKTLGLGGSSSSATEQEEFEILIVGKHAYGIIGI